MNTVVQQSASCSHVLPVSIPVNDNTVSPTCNPPKGYKQVCGHCGHDRFMDGVTYYRCPDCDLVVVHHCRYEAIVGANQ